jgi:hypothetical protein
MDPVRIENSASSGAPDINYLGGWIEDKTIADWPKRENTPVRLPHYTPEQRGWHSRRRRAGGRVHVVLEVMKAETILVFDAADAASGLGHWTREQCLSRAQLVLSPWDAQRFRDFFVRLDRDRYS